MKKSLLLTTVFTTFFAVPEAVLAFSCNTQPSCADLGYTYTAQQCGDIEKLHCPFGGDNYFCVKNTCGTEYKYSCSSISGATGLGQPCENKYTACSCGSLTWNPSGNSGNGSCDSPKIVIRTIATFSWVPGGAPNNMCINNPVSNAAPNFDVDRTGGTYYESTANGSVTLKVYDNGNTSLIKTFDSVNFVKPASGACASINSAAYTKTFDAGLSDGQYVYRFYPADNCVIDFIDYNQSDTDGANGFYNPTTYFYDPEAAGSNYVLNELSYVASQKYYNASIHKSGVSNGYSTEQDLLIDVYMHCN